MTRIISGEEMKERLLTTLRENCKHDQGIQQKMGGVICNRCRIILHTGTINDYIIKKAKEDRK